MNEGSPQPRTSAALARAPAGQPFKVTNGILDPFARTQQLSKPLIAVVHGDTSNMAHELHLARVTGD